MDGRFGRAESLKSEIASPKSERDIVKCSGLILPGFVAEPLRPPKADFDLFISPASKARFMQATGRYVVRHPASGGG